jgi:signal peptidase I
MRPIIGVGDVITVGRVEPSKVRIGDVVAFQEGQNVVIHRVIGKSAAKNTPLIFRHRGDNGASSGLFQAPNLIGRVLIVEKEGREISLNTSWYVMSNKILGWRLRLADNLDRMKFTHISVVVHLVLRPVWKLYYRLLLNRL